MPPTIPWHRSDAHAHDDVTPAITPSQVPGPSHDQAALEPRSRPRQEPSSQVHRAGRPLTVPSHRSRRHDHEASDPDSRPAHAPTLSQDQLARSSGPADRTPPGADRAIGRADGTIAGLAGGGVEEGAEQSSRGHVAVKTHGVGGSPGAAGSIAIFRSGWLSAFAARSAPTPDATDRHRQTAARSARRRGVRTSWAGSDRMVLRPYGGAPGHVFAGSRSLS
jgi:hypothetical protein